jgi:hypothetical protein
VSDLLAMYRELRDDGFGHHGAIRRIAELTTIDRGSVARTLERAEIEQRRRVRPAHDREENA